MRTVCVTTTIRVPRVLELYAAYDPGVFFIVVGDRKSPDDEIKKFLDA